MDLRILKHFFGKISLHLVLSCLVSSLLVLSLCLSLSLSVFLSLSLSVSLSFSLSPCDVCVVVVLVLFGGPGVFGTCAFVCVCVLRHAEKTWKTRVWVQKRWNMYAWCRYTRGRFQRTHGDVLNPHTDGMLSSSVLLTKICQRMVITFPPEVHQRNFWIFPILKFEQRSRTTCPRFLQSFAFPDNVVQLQFSWGTLRKKAVVKWFGFTFAPFSNTSNDLHGSIAPGEIQRHPKLYRA